MVGQKYVLWANSSQLKMVTMKGNSSLYSSSSESLASCDVPVYCKCSIQLPELTGDFIIIRFFQCEAIQVSKRLRAGGRDDFPTYRRSAYQAEATVLCPHWQLVAFPQEIRMPHKTSPTPTRAMPHTLRTSASKGCAKFHVFQKVVWLPQKILRCFSQRGILKLTPNFPSLIFNANSS